MLRNSPTKFRGSPKIWPGCTSVEGGHQSGLSSSGVDRVHAELTSERNCVQHDLDASCYSDTCIRTTQRGIATNETKLNHCVKPSSPVNISQQTALSSCDLPHGADDDIAPTPEEVGDGIIVDSLPTPSLESYSDLDEYDDDDDDDGFIGEGGSQCEMITNLDDESIAFAGEEDKWPIPLRDEDAGSNDRLCLNMSGDDIRNQVDRTGILWIRVITWNQQASVAPSADELALELIPKNRFHIIAFGAQECENSIAKSIIVPQKTKWEATVGAAVGSDYTMLCSHTLQATHSIVFVHRAIVSLVSQVTSTAIATGLGETLGNKGGIGTSFYVGETSFCFVNAHLAAHQTAVNRRTFEFLKISRGIASESARNDHNSEINDTPLQEESQRNPLIDMFDMVFWSGDMNFRIHGTREVVDGLLDRNMHAALLNNDQLTMLMKFNPVFKGFSEGPLNFRPTYKFDRGTDVYDTSTKRRVPSWTDRVLYKKSNKLRLIAYNSVTDVRTSDHRPVYASFRAQMKRRSRRISVEECATNQTRSQVCTIS